MPDFYTAQYNLSPSEPSGKNTRNFRLKKSKRTSLDNTEKNSLSDCGVVDKVLRVSIMDQKSKTLNVGFS